MLNRPNVSSINLSLPQTKLVFVKVDKKSGCVMKRSIIFCLKNIPEDSLSFFGEDEFDLKRYANNSGQSAIVIQKTNTEIKVIYAKHTFRTRAIFRF